MKRMTAEERVDEALQTSFSVQAMSDANESEKRPPFVAYHWKALDQAEPSAGNGWLVRFSGF